MQDKGAVQLPHGSPDEAYPHGRKRLSDLDQVSPPVRNHGGGDPPVRRTQVILLFSPSPLQFYQLSCLVKWSRYPLFNDGSNALAVIMVSSSMIEIRWKSHFQSLNAENHPKSLFLPQGVLALRLQQPGWRGRWQPRPLPRHVARPDLQQRVHRAKEVLAQKRQ